MDEIIKEDLERIVNSNFPIEVLKNQTVLITGATGMIGSLLIKSLLYFNIRHNTNIRIVGLARSQERAHKVFADMLDWSNFGIIYDDVQTISNIQEPIDYIIHGASITSSKEFVDTPVETIQTAIFGSSNLLELAKEKKVKGFVFLSSMEIYGVTDFRKTDVKEEDYGYIDLLNVRSSYSESKRMVECMCACYAKQYGIPVKIARLCQTFGAGVEYDDNRVFAQFARCIIEKKDIILHTSGETVRNYCYTSDAIRAILYILIKGENGIAYNVANEETAISIRDMAEMLAKHYADSNIKVVYDIAEKQNYGYNPTIKLKLNTERIQALGWNATVNLMEMYDRMIKSMILKKS